MQQQTSLPGLCWPSGVAGQSPLLLNPAAQANPSMTFAMLAAMRGTGASNAAGLYSPAAVATVAPPIYTTLADAATFPHLVPGYYPFAGSASPAASTTTAIVSSPYNPVEVSFIALPHFILISHFFGLSLGVFLCALEGGFRFKLKRIPGEITLSRFPYFSHIAFK